ncbi:MAG: hypothetical protein Kapaf2KO_07690 [Candidatus Kapaibacteriales bacterium]
MWIVGILVFVGVVVFMLNSWGYHQRLEGTSTPETKNLIFMIAMLWYLPKLIIFPFLLFGQAGMKLWAKIEEEPKERKHRTALERKSEIASDKEITEKDTLSESESKTITDVSINIEENEKENKQDRKQDKKYNRRKFVRDVGWSLAGVPFVITGYGAFKTVHDFQINKVKVRIKNLPKQFEGLRIAQLSDLHLGSFPDYKPFQEVRRLTNELKSDIITVTGDFVNFDPMELKPHFESLSELSADLGVYACLGNHDHYMSDKNHKILKGAIEQTGIDLIDNSSRQFELNGSTLNIIGVDNIGMKQDFGDFDKAIRGIELENPSILLCHDPRNWDDTVIKNYPDIDLMLAGHTHGGQIAVELLGLELYPVSMVYKRYVDMYTKGSQHLYVNRGIGTTGPPIRIGVPPEITEFELVSV